MAHVAEHNAPTLASVSAQSNISADDRITQEMERLRQSFGRLRESNSALFLSSGFEGVFCSDQSFYCCLQAFLTCRQKFVAAGKPAEVDVMFHYTGKRAMDSITYSGIQVIGRRSFFGVGIYVGNNPHAFKNFGDVGLIVLVLKGSQKCVQNGLENHEDGVNTNTFVGNKLRPTPSQYYDEIVLRTQAQVLPLFQYPRSLTNNSDLFDRMLQLLKKWTVEAFPGCRPPRLEPIYPNMNDLRAEFKNNNAAFGQQQSLFITQDARYQDSPWKKKFMELTQLVAPLGQDQCQSGCQVWLLDGRKGDMSGPSSFYATLVLTLRRNLHCSGFPYIPTIALDYVVHSGLQTITFTGTQHTAYLPYNNDGRDLLKRLRSAFRSGLTFHVLQQPNGWGVACGTGIPHKTSLTGGDINGWPDNTYFDTCNQHLCRLGVPHANAIPDTM